eukprot:CAMPEP_0195603126 /NCGR_PEP_ID=MMETSP0815-20121206/5961_1 /TAXON_ID=97485 /ORGANISM="Prymnesium parvum, Strain Texoma1" /LENGTH=264 /DNA_ID=CAMNT_0040742731 /DNA_START=53 /DNA_END=845 /DNA_ORIENTATION=-
MPQCVFSLSGRGTAAQYTRLTCARKHAALAARRRRSPAERHPIGAPIRPRPEAAVAVALYDLRAAEDGALVAVHQPDVVPHPPQLLGDGGGDPLLQQDLAAPFAAVGDAADAEARRVDRRLRLHAEGEEVHHQLHVALRLHEAAHVGEARVQLAVFGGDRGEDRVVRPLRRAQLIRVAWLEREVGAAVLQREAAALGHEAGAEPRVVRVGHRDGVPVRVDHLEADGVTPHDRRALAHIHRRRMRVDQLAPLRRVLFGEQLLKRN